MSFWIAYSTKCNVQGCKKFDIQNPIIGNLLSQVNANKISDAKVKQLLGQEKDEELQARLDMLRKKLIKAMMMIKTIIIITLILMIAMMMIKMLMENNYTEDSVILDDW